VAYSIVQFVGDGTSTTYSFSFPYIDSSHLEVLVSGEPVGYTLTNTNTITLDTPAPSGAYVTIARNTPKGAVPVDFSDGSILREADLDVLAVFSTFVAQETYDRADQSIGYDSGDGTWDASSRVIKNVANPVEANDAVNKGTIDNLYPFVATVAGSITNVNTVGAAVANVNTVAGNIASVNTVAGNTANVSKVAAVDAKVTTVANNDANVTTVAGSITSVNTTAASIANVNTTAGSIGNVGTVATNIANVNAVAGNNTNITAAAGNAANINSAVANSSNINAAVANAANISTVAGNTTNVTKVAAIDTKVTTVANNDANVTTVAGINTAVSTVAGIASNVTTVANNNANVTAVAGNAANINAAVGNASNINAAVSNSSNINAVVANATNINAVAAIDADVTTVATNIAAILDAPSQAAGAAASAVSAASSAATAAAVLDNFDDRYLGAKESDPALDNDGNALLVGALYFNTTDGVMKIYTTSGWISSSSASVATLATFEFVATEGQTVFTGSDENGQALSYTAPAIIVTLNGVRLRPDDDYTATDGVNLTLAAATTAGDELVVDAFGNFLVADTYSRGQVDAFISSKQDVLISGTNIKTLNSESLLGSGDITIAVPAAFPAGTAMLFAQTSAPTGWTKSTTHDNKALRLVSGTAGSGGSAAFTTAFGTPSVSGSVSLSGSVGATTLTTAQLASHSHTVSTRVSGGGGGGAALGNYQETSAYNLGTTSAGSNSSHTHSFSGSGSLSSASADINVAYVDVIIATKD
jgi:hypothetical protein